MSKSNARKNPKKSSAKTTALRSTSFAPPPKAGDKAAPVKSASTSVPARPIARGLGRLQIAIIAAVVVVLAAGGGIAYWLLSGNNSKAVTPALPANYRVGQVTCKELPKFVTDLGYDNKGFLSTSERGVQGLALVDKTTTPNKIYQHPSWKSAGYLAPIEFGSKGVIFVAPAPSISVLYNPADQQNIVYKVDPNSGVMAAFANLPKAAPPNDENPFGVIGLAYDCETSNLYAASVAGSSRTKEVGRIYRINPSTGKVESQLDNVDPFGMVVFNSATGKRLYYGLARYPEIWSVGLDANGNFVGQPRLEISLANLGPRGSDKARAIKFDPTDLIMEVSGIEFSFNLIAPTEKQETTYRFSYDVPTDKWQVVSNSPANSP